MPMKNPPHPGRIVLEEILQPLGLSVTAGARVLGVSRQAFYTHKRRILANRVR